MSAEAPARPWARSEIKKRFVPVTVEADPIGGGRFRLTVSRRGSPAVYAIAPSLTAIPETAILAAKGTVGPSSLKRLYYVRKLNINFPEPKG